MVVQKDGNVHIGSFDSSSIREGIARVKLDVKGTDAIRIPSGTTDERPDIVKKYSDAVPYIPDGGTILDMIHPEPELNENYTDGYVRYNTDLKRFEGFTGEHWISLNGLTDENGDTRITTESDHGVNEDILRFYAFDISHNVPHKVAEMTGDMMKFYNWETGMETLVIDASNGDLHLYGDLKIGAGDVLTNMKVGELIIGHNAVIYSSYCFVCGEDNITYAGNSYTSQIGQANRMIQSDSSLQVGVENVLRSGVGGVCAGRYNKLRKSIGGFMHGEYNLTTNGDFCSFIGGTLNNSEEGICNILSGKNNYVYDCSLSIISGENGLHLRSHHNISIGNNNESNQARYSLITGSKT